MLTQEPVFRYKIPHTANSIRSLELFGDARPTYLHGDNPNPLPEITDFQSVTTGVDEGYYPDQFGVEELHGYQQALDSFWMSFKIVTGNNQAIRQLVLDESRRIIKRARRAQQIAGVFADLKAKNL